jgi:hypothetical protein
VLSYNPCPRLWQVSFLRYIRQWGKKVVFVLNKADLFESEVEVSCHRTHFTSVALSTEHRCYVKNSSCLLSFMGCPQLLLIMPDPPVSFSSLPILNDSLGVPTALNLC